jgi:hypothetical protein
MQDAIKETLLSILSSKESKIMDMENSLIIKYRATASAIETHNNKGKYERD